QAHQGRAPQTDQLCFTDRPVVLSCSWDFPVCLLLLPARCLADSAAVHPGDLATDAPSQIKTGALLPACTAQVHRGTGPIPAITPATVGKKIPRPRVASPPCPAAPGAAHWARAIAE